MTITPEQIADEERRAQLWRDQAARRAQYQQGLRLSLAGSYDAAQALREAWLPVELWLLEGHEPAVAPEDDPTLDPLGLSDQVNVGT